MASTPEKIEIDIEAAVSVTVVRPGDTLLVGYDRLLSDDEYALLQERFQPLHDEHGVRTFVVENAQHLLVVRKKEGN